jgi:hypothetical protein
MRYQILFCLLLIFLKSTNAQEPSKLNQYLDSNSISINLQLPGETYDFFTSLMKNKLLFVLGEGGSHQLTLYNRLRVYLLFQFTKLNLKYFFVEYGRSMAYLNNAFLQQKADSSERISVTETPYRIEMNQIRQLYQAGHHFQYKGIDMESAPKLYGAIKKITPTISTAAIQSTSFLRSVLIDTGYLHYDDGSYFNNQKHFLVSNFRPWQKSFKDDPEQLKNILPAVNYEQIKYFLFNPQTKPPTGNRNPGLAENLLSEIAPIDTNATYLLSLGIAHTLAPNNESVISLLQTNKLLKDKIVVMNTYCDECDLRGNIIHDPSLRFMKADLLNIFRASAKAELTIFNLSKLPPEFNFIKKYGDLLLFAKKQK